MADDSVSIILTVVILYISDNYTDVWSSFRSGRWITTCNIFRFRFNVKSFLDWSLITDSVLPLVDTAQ